MPRLIWSPSSLRDLRGIDEGLGPLNGAAAARLLRAVRSTANRLVGYPPIGRAVDETFRVLRVRTTPYLLIYRLRKDGIEIVRARHGSENWSPDPEGAL